MTPSPESRCPLCLHGRQSPSWLGVRRFSGHDYRWVQCANCGSSYYEPRPDDAVLKRIYGAEYLHVNQSADCPGSPKDHRWVVRMLQQRPPGIFIDYGCGAGDLLIKASHMGWEARGVELNEDVADRVASSTGLPVSSNPATLAGENGGPSADVVHAGDVIEHFAHLDEELDRLLALLKPGGLLLIQGPLAAGACLFNLVFKTAGRLRTGRVINAAPTHLIASTRRGVETLIRRRGWDPIEMTISEVAWPGPWKWEASPRSAALFALRQVSQLVSRCAPGHLGNRYRFAAVKRPERPSE